jgi:hypothetical protein
MSILGREDLRRLVARYLLELRGVGTAITGDDLLRAGVPAGPGIAAGLGAALRARLDGEARGRADELAAALAVAREA